MSNSEHVEESLPSFDINLLPTGDPGSGFNFDHRNNPITPWQRQRILQRKDAFNIQCKSLDVVHGKFEQDKPGLATLLVFKFWFDKRKLGRRLASADIEIKFSGMDPEGNRPEVYAISPHDRAALVETSIHQEDFREASTHADASLAGASAGGNYSWSKTITQDIADATTVTGSIDLIDDYNGTPNCASWTLLENETCHTGIPATFQVAILLLRDDMDLFQCTVDVKARADWKTRLEWLVGSKSNDDPVLFKPGLPPTNNLKSYDVNNLGAIIRTVFWDAGLVGPTKPKINGSEN
ncbi:hypothetical protein GL218_02581 [Daldinia childiae]|uniref:uncharacterized protein n=1 Tax=Daldinia childiae TaxID=326645 RepID=UPI00144530DC|nr:uncharacterized protein GL218_02581 [Daldinia childiae]KAF3063840.1 hypothetical protein GL218_02581 [Daldinia childiae]